LKGWCPLKGPLPRQPLGRPPKEETLEVLPPSPLPRQQCEGFKSELPTPGCNFPPPLSKGTPGVRNLPEKGRRPSDPSLTRFRHCSPKTSHFTKEKAASQLGSCRCKTPRLRSAATSLGVGASRDETGFFPARSPTPARQGVGSAAPGNDRARAACGWRRWKKREDSTISGRGAPTGQSSGQGWRVFQAPGLASCRSTGGGGERRGLAGPGGGAVSRVHPRPPFLHSPFGSLRRAALGPQAASAVAAHLSPAASPCAAPPDGHGLGPGLPDAAR
jgi:hypothetical protein